MTEVRAVGEQPHEPSGRPQSRSGTGVALRRRQRRATTLAVLGSVPFWAFFGLFFVLPTGALLWLSIRRPAQAARAAVPASNGGLLGQAPSPGKPAVPGHPAEFTLHYLSLALHGAFRTGLLNSVQVSLVTSVLGAVLGTILCWAVVNGPDRLKQLVLSASAVFANFGGVPLAFLFIATLGSAGIVTRLLQHAHVGLTDHFNLYSVTGVELVYLYFMIPLMVLVIAPALEALRPQWREAAENLGAGTWQYWRYVAGPVLLPNVAGSVSLLFCSAFSAYATAAALTNGTLALTPLQIKSELSGNVLSGADAQHTAAALALVMVLVVVPLTVIYQLLERRTSRWLQT